MADAPAKGELLILGVTRAGRPFRPSDWAERLCGVMSPFRPGGAASMNDYLGYSPYVRPTFVDNVKAVIVDARLEELDLRAYDFVISFARDNDLQTCDWPIPATPPAA